MYLYVLFLCYQILVIINQYVYCYYSLLIKIYLLIEYIKLYMYIIENKKKKIYFFNSFLYILLSFLTVLSSQKKKKIQSLILRHHSSLTTVAIQPLARRKKRLRLLLDHKKIDRWGIPIRIF